MTHRDPQIVVSQDVNLLEYLDRIPTHALERELWARKVNGNAADGDEELSPEQALLQRVAFRVRVLGWTPKEALDDLMRAHDVDWQYTRVGEAADAA